MVHGKHEVDSSFIVFPGGDSRKLLGSRKMLQWNYFDSNVGINATVLKVKRFIDLMETESF